MFHEDNHVKEDPLHWIQPSKKHTQQATTHRCKTKRLLAERWAMHRCKCLHRGFRSFRPEKKMKGKKCPTLPTWMARYPPQENNDVSGVGTPPFPCIRRNWKCQPPRLLNKRISWVIPAFFTSHSLTQKLGP